MLKPAKHWNVLVRVSAVAVIFGTLVGCTGTEASEAPPASAPSTTTHSVPFTSHRAPDPKVESPEGAQLKASETSLSQLWAITEGDPSEEGQLDPRAWGMVDFFNAIATRCYPRLTADQTADLDARYGVFLATLSAEPLIVADLRTTKRSYFDEPTELCM